MVQRLKEVRKALGLNQTEFAKHLGITQTAYSMIESGNRPLADKYVKVICSTFNVSEAWFLTGDGEMFVSSPYEKEFTDIFGHLTPETQQYLLLMAKELLNTQQKLLSPNPERPTSHNSEK
jgi:transcriptional regulator with XRE-family HTH domain